MRRSLQIMSSLVVMATRVTAGEQALTTQIAALIKQCPSQRIVLAGYSLGAWTIDNWLAKNGVYWLNIKGVMLYGDPNWIRSDGTATIGFRHFVPTVWRSRARCAGFRLCASAPAERGDASIGGLVGPCQTLCLRAGIFRC